MPGGDVMAGGVADIGIIGKLPAHGDFVRRGGPAAVLALLDRWLDRELGAVVATGLSLDDAVDALDGVHGTFAHDGDVVLAAVVAGGDSVGRRFPLLATSTGTPAGRDAAAAWCAAAGNALAAVRDGGGDADAALAAVVAIAPPAAASDAATGWWRATGTTPPPPVADGTPLPATGEGPMRGAVTTDMTGAPIPPALPAPDDIPAAGAGAPTPDSPLTSDTTTAAAPPSAGHGAPDIPDEYRATGLAETNLPADAGRPADPDSAADALHVAGTVAANPPMAAAPHAPAPAKRWWQPGRAAVPPATNGAARNPAPLPTGAAFRALLAEGRR